MIDATTSLIADALPPAARAIAEARAASDRDLLVALRKKRLVSRDSEVGKNVAGAGAFVRDIESRASGKNLAIKARKRRR